MTRGEAIRDFLCKTILPVAAAALLYCIFRSACVKDGALDYLRLWILCGLPFGLWRLLVAAWYVPLTLYRLLTAGSCTVVTED